MKFKQLFNEKKNFMEDVDAYFKPIREYIQRGSHPKVNFKYILPFLELLHCKINTKKRSYYVDTKKESQVFVTSRKEVEGTFTTIKFLDGHVEEYSTQYKNSLYSLIFYVYKNYIENDKWSDIPKNLS